MALIQQRRPSLGLPPSVMELLEIDFSTFNSPTVSCPQPIEQVPVTPTFSNLFNFDVVKPEGNCAVPPATASCGGDVSASFDLLNDEMMESNDSEGLVPDLDNLAAPSWQSMACTDLFMNKSSMQSTDSFPSIATSSVDLELDLESDASSSSSSESSEYESAVPRVSSPNSPRLAGRVRRRSSNRCPLPKGWSDDLLDMSTKELNQFFKSQNLSQEKIAELKTCRRRIKNRTYTRDSRSRKYQYCNK